eukprot:scaffold1735_cov66-Phaeocystis_antarctica.AAC.2
MSAPRWPSHCRRKTSWYCGRSIETVENMSSRLADAIFVATRTTSSREASTGVCSASARTSLIRLTAVGGSLSVELLPEAAFAWLGSPRRSACRCFAACRAVECWRRAGTACIDWRRAGTACTDSTSLGGYPATCWCRIFSCRTSFATLRHTLAQTLSDSDSPLVAGAGTHWAGGTVPVDDRAERCSCCRRTRSTVA